MEQSKVRSYFLYAIGEILLVVIGILIALQINNWNEERKEHILEIKVLNEISEDMGEDIFSLENDVSLNQRRIKSIEVLRRAIQTDLPFHDTLAYHFGAINFNTTYTLKVSGYDNLKNVGFQVISNDPLRKAITDLYETEYSFLKEGELIAEKMTYDYFSPRYLDYFSTITLQTGPRAPIKYYYPKDYDALKTDLDFSLLLDYNSSIKKENLYNLNFSLDRIRQTQQIVLEYLEQINPPAD